MNAMEVFSHWRVVRQGLIEALDELADVQLDFVPREGLWSLGTVARHIANAEEGWFRYAVTRELAEWPAAYTAQAYPTVEAVGELLAEVHARTEAFLETVDVSELDQVVDLPWDEGLALRQIIWHILEHEASHRGEIYLMLGLMGLEAPDV
jgi:uncharacterized damage-inducible protein DinB